MTSEGRGLEEGLLPNRDLSVFASELLADLCDHFPTGRSIALEWRPYRVTAGIAYYRTWTIGLSHHVLREEAAVRDTLIHEYAHLLAFARHGQKAANHGPHWQTAMRELGAEPIVRHRYEVVRNERRQTVTYRCESCGKQFDRHRRLPQKGRWVHAGCGGGLKLVAVSGR
ncbi:M48 family peptidase [bacterium]|nr:MAG: M48 family peptidase [bacterium]